MKYIVLVLCSVFLFSCSDSFINHELKYEKMGECGDLQTDVMMKSNINGERYEFIRCLDEDFNGKNYTVERVGDSIVVKFPKSGTKKTTKYHLILDIDAKPVYRYIVLDGVPIAIKTIDVPKTKDHLKAEN